MCRQPAEKRECLSAGQWAVGADADRRLAKIVQEVARNIGWRPVDAGGD